MTDYKVKHGDDVHVEQQDIGEDLGMTTIWGISIAFFFITFAASAWLVGLFGKTVMDENVVKAIKPQSETLLHVREDQLAQLGDYAVVDAAAGRVRITLDNARSLAIRELTRDRRNPPPATMLLNGTETAALNPCNPDSINPCAEVPADTTSEQTELTDNAH